MLSLKPRWRVQVKTFGVPIADFYLRRNAIKIAQGLNRLGGLTRHVEFEIQDRKTPDPKPVTTVVEGIKLFNVHDPVLCAGRACVVHNPTDHHMRAMKLHWREDRAIFERICTHGVGHPDPSQFEYWKEIGQMSHAVHGCDGCCQKGTG